jgi:hypothetical protein
MKLGHIMPSVFPALLDYRHFPEALNFCLDRAQQSDWTASEYDNSCVSHGIGSPQLILL